MEHGKLNARKRIYTILLLAVVFVLAASFCAFPVGSGSTATGADARDNAAFSQQMARPDSIQINLMDSPARQSALQSQMVYRFPGAQRYFINTAILIPFILCFTWLSVFSFHSFNKQTNRPLPAIAIPIGGNAPPFKLA